VGSSKAVLPRFGRVPTSTRASVDWSAYKPMLRCDDLATIYPYTLTAIRKAVQRRSAKLPTPCGTRPFVFRREDVKRHYDRLQA
jgi:hypothetical protein